MYLRVLGRIIWLIGFEILRSIHGAVQSVTWRLNGVLRDVQNAKRPERYDRCAQVLDVHLFYSFDPMVFTSRRNFVCSHNRFDSPRYVVENDHVTLLNMDDDYAVFAEANGKDMQLWKMEYSGFMKLAQLKYCSRLILVPRHHFRRMADELGDPVRPVVFLFSVGRCGSTLLTQIMESTGRCVSISEPAPLLYVASKLMSGKEHPDSLRSMCRDTLRWICRPCPSFNPLAYFVKVAPSCSMILPVVYDVFPSSKYLFMYRNVVDVAQSFCKVIQELPFLFAMCAAAKRSGYLRRKFLTMFDMREVFESSGAAWNDLILGAVGFAKVCQLYLECRGNGGGLPISAIRYEDFQSDPDDAIRKTFDFCQLPSSLISEAVRDGLTADAQRNSPLSISNLRRKRTLKFDEDTKRFVNSILHQANLPLIGEDCLLDGTITNKI